jgi:hypothetical protein
MAQRYAAGSIMKRGRSVALRPSAAETASTTGPTLETGDAGAVYVQVDVTAASGTSPTLTVVVEGSNDNTTWFTLGTLGANGYAVGPLATAPANFAGPGSTRAMFPAPQFVRTRSVIGGTSPSFTYQVVVEPDT